MSMQGSLRSFVSAEKTDVTVSAWQQKKMPKSGDLALKFKASRSWSLGPQWRWCVVTLKVGSTPHKVWICYHPTKENYCSAVTRASTSGEVLVLGRLEFHGTHPGWHVHGCCSQPTSEMWGRLAHPGLTRVPEAKSKHRQQTFISDDYEALAIAGRKLGIPQIIPPPAPQLALELKP